MFEAAPRARDATAYRMASGKGLVRPNRARGFSFLFALILVAIVGLALTAYAQATSHAARREREAQLLWVGERFRVAIALYYLRTPGPVRVYPQRLEDLLNDSRYPSAQRYLRELYRDPMTGKAQWGTVAAPGGGIMGVYSLAPGTPIKTGGFPLREQSFTGAHQYSDWVFSYEPPQVAVASPPPPPGK